MPSIDLSTELDAVNTILSAVGSQPVTDLSGSAPDAAAALNTLREFSREVQDVGWHFNTENDVEFTPDTSGYIQLPPGVLKFDTEPGETADVVLRGRTVYDRENHTKVFTKPLKAEVVYLLEWEELPEAARRYIMIRAARSYHDRYVGSDTIHRFTENDEMTAAARLIEANADQADNNIFQTAEMQLRLRR
jgi:hypothetical protein